MGIILGSYDVGQIDCIEVQFLHLDQYLEIAISKSQNQEKMEIRFLSGLMRMFLYFYYFDGSSCFQLFIVWATPSIYFEESQMDKSCMITVFEYLPYLSKIESII